jgi:hypothetical protein
MAWPPAAQGGGPRWEAIERLFEAHRARLGSNAARAVEEGPSTFRRSGRQGTLFDL